MNEVLSAREFEERCNRTLFGKSVWAVTNYMGSMFVIDLGSEIHKIVKSRTIKIGENTISIRNARWILRDAFEAALLDSDILCDENRNILISSILGSRFSSLKVSAREIVIKFDSNAEVILDLTNYYRSESPVFVVKISADENLLIDELGNPILLRGTDGRLLP